MSTNMDMAVGTIQRVISMVIKSIYSKDYHDYDKPEGYSHQTFPNFFVYVSKLPITDQAETVQHYYTLAVMTPLVREPVDILDIIKHTKGIDFRYCGVRSPCVINDEQYLTVSEIDAMVRLVVDANPRLVKAIEEHNKGGRNEFNRTRK
ncbi:hypothetical protein PQD71_gp150 [Kosakonia phage Kc263]|uniref:Uncharacterized protein n=1 Tax=Kosakonia phage Kc263 TaxID=2863194 RepID=A0AAE7WFA8_9CAUD|nr:hypothetical protein PQD71_gp150 [Kosakonia phage Kc263]QYN80043.1 hypothetical protein [Kosakonia phage Kc263]